MVRFTSAFCSFLSDLSSTYPITIVLSVLIFDCILSLFAGVKFYYVSFDDPLRGFEARGSPLSARINTWKIITGRSHSDIDQRLSLTPRKEEVVKKSESPKIRDAIDLEEEEEQRRVKQEAAKKIQPLVRDKNQVFCGSLSDSYVQLVIESSTGDDLFRLGTIKLICELDANIRKDVLLESSISSEDSTCKSWTLPNMIAAARNKSSCRDLTGEDVKFVKSLLKRCHPDYRRKDLHDSCAKDPRSCPVVPEECHQQSLVFDMFHYILDFKFVDNLESRQAHLVKTNIFLPIAKSSRLGRFYELLTMSLKRNKLPLKVSSMDLGMKDALFEDLLLEDSKLMAMALGIVALIILYQTKSLLVLVMTILNLAASFATATFLYEFIFRIDFFPFMNVLTLVILVAVGSDNTLIYCRIWRLESRAKHPLPVENVVRSTLERTFSATSITSLTTSLALSSSIFSDITSIRCFSIFAAICVAVQHILTTISLPSALLCSREGFNPFPCGLGEHLQKLAGSIVRRGFKFMSKSKIILAPILLALAGASIAVFANFLRLPESEHIATFNEDHPFEKYDAIDRHSFKFSRKLDNDERMMPLTFVFGAEPMDNGNPLDPEDRGNLKLTNNFNPESPRSQEWLLNFCKQVQNSSFYELTPGPHLSNCFIDTLKTWVEGRNCSDPITGHSNEPCCKSSKFPFTPSTFDTCIGQAIELLHRTPTFVVSRDAPGVRFSRSDSKVALVIIQFLSKFNYSSSYKEMKSTLDKVESWMDQKIRNAPESFARGWFVFNHLELFALQESLKSGVYTSVTIALFLTFISVGVTTRSFALTIATLLTVTSIITSTLAILSYCFEWQVNIVESVIILVAIGMSVDLPLHLTMAFREQDILRNKTLASLEQVSVPLFSAALTTTLAGISLVASKILAYQKVATFLVVISSMNLIFTFFLLPLLLLMIEEYGFKSQSTSEFVRTEAALQDLESSC